ncbi:hypothetical protein STCU_10433 [Strigomonas culicis]|uniref:Uncharacterized protein n=1 Tax=Strigomonas culicis TaxID=28005 RepID=S9UT66_9TRYP|nr:hypothetical protein STCU_10433 [Strigomonas culicis]|eukprot:EPY17746.1 hypothetical protein STCU_10433 [Strigomonas culicis]
MLLPSNPPRLCTEVSVSAAVKVLSAVLTGAFAAAVSLTGVAAAGPVVDAFALTTVAKRGKAGTLAGGANSRFWPLALPRCERPVSSAVCVSGAPLLWRADGLAPPPPSCAPLLWKDAVLMFILHEFVVVLSVLPYVPLSSKLL